jgi:hypothetical protein
MNRFQISTEISDQDMVELHKLNAQTYWARGIPFETFKRGVQNSLCFKASLGSEVVGFERTNEGHYGAP